MDLELTDDQELFRETTAKFIENTCPLSTVREWAEKEPAGLPGRLVAAGRRARLDLAPGLRGGWWRQRVGSRPARSDPGGRGHGALGLPGTASPDERGGGGAVGVRHRGTKGALPARPPRRGRPSPPGAWPNRGSPGLPHGISLTATRRGGDFVLSGKKGPAEAAGEAGFFVVAALVDGEVTQFLVDARHSRCERGREPRASTSSGVSPPCRSTMSC